MIETKIAGKIAGKKVEMRNRKVLLFDFDGVLANTIPSGFRATCAVFKEVGLPPPTFGEFHREYRPPPTDFYRLHGLSEEAMPNGEIWEMWFKYMDYSETELFPDVMETLMWLRQESPRLNIVHFGIISTQRNHILLETLFKLGILGFFPEVVGGIDDKSKELVRIASEQHVNKSDVVFVGDFPSDMVDGNRAKVFTVGITQSMPGMADTLRHQLEVAGANECIDYLHELHRIFNLIL